MMPLKNDQKSGNLAFAIQPISAQTAAEEDFTSEVKPYEDPQIIILQKNQIAQRASTPLIQGASTLCTKNQSLKQSSYEEIETKAPTLFNNLSKGSPLKQQVGGGLQHATSHATLKVSSGLLGTKSDKLWFNSKPTTISNRNVPLTVAAKFSPETAGQKSTSNNSLAIGFSKMAFKKPRAVPLDTNYDMQQYLQQNTQVSSSNGSQSQGSGQNINRQIGQ